MCPRQVLADHVGELRSELVVRGRAACQTGDKASQQGLGTGGRRRSGSEGGYFPYSRRCEKSAGHPPGGIELSRHYYLALGEFEVVDVVAHLTAPAENHRIQFAHRVE